MKTHENALKEKLQSIGVGEYPYTKEVLLSKEESQLYDPSANDVLSETELEIEQEGII